MIKAYIDNSILSELRLRPLQTNKSQFVLNKERIKFIFTLFRKYRLYPQNFLLTEKLFLEVIGCGKIRKKIINDHLAVIEKAKEEFLKERSFISTAEFLESFFKSNFKKALPQDQITIITLNYLSKHPFIDLLYSFEQNILEYAANTTKNNSIYQQFISSLVIDSVIRTLILDTDQEIDDKYFTEQLTFLIKRYESSLHTHLLLFSAGAKQYVESKFKIKDKPNLIRLKDDFADAEPQQLVFYGKDINGSHYPITFLTYETLSIIKERLRYYFQGGIIAIAQNKPSANKPLCIGKTIVIENFDNSIYQEIPSELYLQNLPKNSYSFIGSKASSKTDAQNNAARKASMRMINKMLKKETQP